MNSRVWGVWGEQWWDKVPFVSEFKEKCYGFFSCKLCPLQSSCFGSLFLLALPLSIHHSVCIFSSHRFSFQNLSLFCPQSPAAIFPYVWRTQLYSCSFLLSCAFWELFSLLRDKEAFKASRNGYIWAYTLCSNNKCVCERRCEVIPCDHRAERICNHVKRCQRVLDLCQGQ